MANPVPRPSAVASVAGCSLAGKRVVITRAVSQSSDLFEKLKQCGALPVSLALVSFSAPLDCAPLDEALGKWAEFDWVLFTSANAVQFVVARSVALGRALDGGAKGPHIAAVGPATQNAALKSGLRVDHVAHTHLGVALARELEAQLRNGSVFLPRSDRANPDLPAALKQLGVQLTEVIAYRTLPPSDVTRDRFTNAVAHEADVAIFFSPSAVHNLADLIGKEALSELASTVAVAAVGPVTARALREYGIQRIVTAADTTTAAVIAALESHFAGTARAKPTAGAKHG